MRVSLLTGFVLWCAAALVVPHATCAADAVDAAFDLRMNGHTDQACEQLTKLVAEQPQLAKGWYELARTQFYLMQLDAAQQSIDKATALEPDSAQFHYLAGTVAAYRAVRKSHDANADDAVGQAMQRWLQELEKTVELQPGNCRACIDLVNAYRQTPANFGGDAAKAEPLIARLESTSPVDGAEARALTIDAAQRDEVVALWRRTVDAHGENAAAHAGLALAALRAGDWNLAQQHIDRAVQLDPQRVQLYLDVARTAGTRGDYARATTGVETYLKAEPAPPAPLRAFATFYLAAIQRRQQHTAQAEKLLAEARGLDAHVWTTMVPPPAILFEKP